MTLNVRRQQHHGDTTEPVPLRGHREWPAEKEEKGNPNTDAVPVSIKIPLPPCLLHRHPGHPLGLDLHHDGAPRQRALLCSPRDSMPYSVMLNILGVWDVIVVFAVCRPSSRSPSPPGPSPKPPSSTPSDVRPPGSSPSARWSDWPIARGRTRSSGFAVGQRKLARDWNSGVACSF